MKLKREKTHEKSPTSTKRLNDPSLYIYLGTKSYLKNFTFNMPDIWIQTCTHG